MIQNEIKQTSEHNLKTWCCVDQGTSKIEVTFDKNVFEPAEICRARVALDNTRC
jgi:rRNA processing protein Krr1/Pno1